MSPTLFNIYLDDAIRKWKEQITHYTTNLNNRDFVITVLFADDQAVIANNEDCLQFSIFKLSQILEKYNMRISTNKTKVMAFRGQEPVRSKIVLNNQTIEQIGSFNFLGCMISLYEEKDIQNKIEKFNYINGTIRRTFKNKSNQNTAIKFYKTISIPTITYGSETWTITKENQRRLQSAEMKFLRAIGGYTRMDRKRNTDIRNELAIFNLCERIEEYRGYWLQHLERMDETRITNQMFRYKPRGKRNVGRPKKRWADQNN